MKTAFSGARYHLGYTKRLGNAFLFFCEAYPVKVPTGVNDVSSHFQFVFSRSQRGPYMEDEYTDLSCQFSAPVSRMIDVIQMNTDKCLKGLMRVISFGKWVVVLIGIRWSVNIGRNWCVDIAHVVGALLSRCISAPAPLIRICTMRQSSMLIRTGSSVSSTVSFLLFFSCLSSFRSHRTAKNSPALSCMGICMVVINMIFSAPRVFLSPFIGVPIAFTFIGSWLVGAYVAERSTMEEMPQLVAAFHSLTGLSAVLISVSSVLGNRSTPHAFTTSLEEFLGITIGAATFSGSLIAAAKLHDVIQGNSFFARLRGRITFVCAVKIVSLFTLYTCTPASSMTIPILIGHISASSMLGILLVAPIGGADMPVAISVLNSLSGIAATISGFMLGNNFLVMTGALITSSGAILSHSMCKGINRSLINVLTGVQITNNLGESMDASNAHDHVVTQPEYCAQLLESASRILIVPGFGMAASRSQIEVARLTELLRKRGKLVNFGIHPVAGRLPGHMNVLLAEADIPYDLTLEMDECNSILDHNLIDVVLVLGANDIVNPETDSRNSPIYGMPVIKVWYAKYVVVLKRSMGRGYSGVDNPMFYYENTTMLLGNPSVNLAAITAQLHRETPLCNVEPKYQLNHRLGDSQTAEVFTDALSTDKNFDNDKSFVILLLLGPVEETWAARNQSSRGYNISPCLKRRLKSSGYSLRVCKQVIALASGEDAKIEYECYKVSGNWDAEIAHPLDKCLRGCDILLTSGKVDWGSLVEMKNMDSTLTFPSVFIVNCNTNDSGYSETLELSRITNASIINMALVPRISRSQTLDIMSSTANLVGYRAVLEAFYYLPRISRHCATAGGILPAARVLVIGVGVAGLSAIATARGLGCEVFASDTRPETRDQVTSMGAEFIDRMLTCPVSVCQDVNISNGISEKSWVSDPVETYKEIILNKSIDVVICAAAGVSPPAPILLDENTLMTMKRGSVVIDLVAGMGGNCSVTRVEETRIHEKSGVTIVGRTDFINDIADHASELVFTNYINMLKLLSPVRSGDGNIEIYWDDFIIQTCLVMKNGLPYSKQEPTEVLTTSPIEVDEIAFQCGAEKCSSISPSVATETGITISNAISKAGSESNEMALAIPGNPNNPFNNRMAILLGTAIAIPLMVQILRMDVNFPGLDRYIISLLLGHMSVSSVPACYHTPLVAMTNAISGVILVGGLSEIVNVLNDAQYSSLSTAAFTHMIHSHSGLRIWLTLSAIFVSGVNVCGGLLITDRMVKMFRKSR